MSTELSHLIRDFYLARLGLLLRHEEVARHVSDYDVNNAYQYVINREEAHVSWLQHALLDLHATIPPDPAKATVAEPKGRNGWTALAADDARSQRQFVETWRGRVDGITHARHRKMLTVILGEMLEQARIFEHGAAGRDDLIGSHLAINAREGVVANTRWIE